MPQDLSSTEEQERLAAGFPLDRYKSAGRESLVSRGYGDTRARLDSRNGSGVGRSQQEEAREIHKEGIFERSVLVEDRGARDLDGLPLRSDVMSAAQRPLTSGTYFF